MSTPLFRRFAAGPAALTTVVLIVAPMLLGVTFAHAPAQATAPASASAATEAFEAGPTTGSANLGGHPRSGHGWEAWGWEAWGWSPR